MGSNPDGMGDDLPIGTLWPIKPTAMPLGLYLRSVINIIISDFILNSVLAFYLKIFFQILFATLYLHSAWPKINNSTAKSWLDWSQSNNK